MVTIDSNSGIPIDYETYAFEMSSERGMWFKHHDLRSSLGIENLSPQSFYDLAIKAHNEEKVALTILN